MASDEEVQQIAEQIEQAAKQLAAPYEEIAMLARRLQSSSGGGGGGGAYDPLTAISWTKAFWADDPDWSNPGDGNAVSSWRDAGSEGTSATQGTGANQPIFRSSVAALNSRAAVDFDGGNDELRSVWAPGGWVGVGNPVTLVCVAKADDSTGSYNMVDGADASNRRTIFLRNDGTWGANAGVVSISGGTNDSSPHLFLFYSTSGTGDYLEVDGSVVTGPGTDSGADVLNETVIGARHDSANNWPGEIAFVGVFEGELTGTDKSDFEDWVSTYYGITIA